MESGVATALMEAKEFSLPTIPNARRGFKILYVGPLGTGGTCRDRMQTMVALGVQVIPFNTEIFFTQRSRLSQSIASRFHFGPAVSELNRELVEAARRECGLTHIWIDKGVSIWPETLEELKAVSSAKLIHYTPDPALTFHRSRHFVRSIPKYDLLFTTKPFELELLRQAGASQLVLTHQGFERTRFYPRTPRSTYAADVGFIGHCEGHYARCLRAAAKAAADVKAWGQGWLRYARFFSWAKPVVRGDGLWGEDYPEALCSFKICLGLLSKLIPETTTTRTFEIPACGSFLLAERTDDHQALFEENKEAVFFSSPEEMVDKIRYYLRHDAERNQIAQGGRERCLRSGYSNHDRVVRMLESLP